MLGSKPHLWPGLVGGILLDRAACSASQESPGRTDSGVIRSPWSTVRG